MKVSQVQWVTAHQVGLLESEGPLASLIQAQKSPKMNLQIEYLFKKKLQTCFIAKVSLNMAPDLGGFLTSPCRDKSQVKS